MKRNWKQWCWAGSHMPVGVSPRRRCQQDKQEKSGRTERQTKLQVEYGVSEEEPWPGWVFLLCLFIFVERKLHSWLHSEVSVRLETPQTVSPTFTSGSDYSAARSERQTPVGQIADKHRQQTANGGKSHRVKVRRGRLSHFGAQGQPLNRAPPSPPSLPECTDRPWGRRSWRPAILSQGGAPAAVLWFILESNHSFTEDGEKTKNYSSNLRTTSTHFYPNRKWVKI